MVIKICNQWLTNTASFYSDVSLFQAFTNPPLFTFKRTITCSSGPMMKKGSIYQRLFSLWKWKIHPNQENRALHTFIYDINYIYCICSDVHTSKSIQEKAPHQVGKRISGHKSTIRRTEFTTRIMSHCQKTTTHLPTQVCWNKKRTDAFMQRLWFKTRTWNLLDFHIKCYVSCEFK